MIFLIEKYNLTCYLLFPIRAYGHHNNRHHNNHLHNSHHLHHNIVHKNQDSKYHHHWVLYSTHHPHTMLLQNLYESVKLHLNFLNSLSFTYSKEQE